MSKHARLLENNRSWAKQIITQDPTFFERLSKQQSPDYLWIGCSDSRVPANQIIGLMPGEVFVHRNVANQIIHTDFNCLSVVQYAVEVLNIREIIVCGHYGCGGVQAAFNETNLGLIDNWLSNIKETASRHKEEINQLNTELDKLNKLCELNVIAQVKNLSETTIIKKARAAKNNITIHAWIYNINDGIIRSLG